MWKPSVVGLMGCIVALGWTGCEDGTKTGTTRTGNLTFDCAWKTPTPLGTCVEKLCRCSDGQLRSVPGITGDDCPAPDCATSCRDYGGGGVVVELPSLYDSSACHELCDKLAQSDCSDALIRSHLRRFCAVPAYLCMVTSSEYVAHAYDRETVRSRLECIASHLTSFDCNRGNLDTSAPGCADLRPPPNACSPDGG